jgi:hypothetical protein
VRGIHPSEHVVFLERPPEGKRASFGGDGLRLAPQRDLVAEEGVAGGAVFRRLARNRME